MIVLGDNVAVGVGEPEPLKIARLAKEEHGGTSGRMPLTLALCPSDGERQSDVSGECLGSPDCVRQRSDSREKLWLLPLDTAHDVFGLLNLKVNTCFDRVFDGFEF